MTRMMTTTTTTMMMMMKMMMKMIFTKNNSHHHHHQSHSFRYYHYLLIIILLILLAICKECCSLRIRKFDVPPAKSNGSTATLHCDYDLEGSELYSVKFYKDYVEFYRYLPKEDYPQQSFSLDGIHIDNIKSNSTHVILHRTDLNSDGLYGCEVSTEGPVFATRKNEKLMKIYVLPQDTLTIKGSCDYYRIDEHVNFECISGKGYPQLKLDWFINDLPAPNEFLVHSKPIIEDNGLIQSKLGLSFQAIQNFFQDDSLTLRCSASLMFVYELKTIEYLIDGSKQTQSSSSSSSSSRYGYSTAQINHKEMPRINGVRDKYNVNDVVDLNCSTTTSNAQLSWFINGKKVNSSNLIRYPINHKGEIILGIRFTMEKRHFQTDEIELQCSAFYIKTIADFQEQVIIRTFNSEFLLSQSASCSSSVMDRSHHHLLHHHCGSLIMMFSISIIIYLVL